MGRLSESVLDLKADAVGTLGPNCSPSSTALSLAASSNSSSSPSAQHDPPAYDEHSIETELVVSIRPLSPDVFTGV